jgi:hypothetical protein
MTSGRRAAVAAAALAAPYVPIAAGLLPGRDLLGAVTLGAAALAAPGAAGVLWGRGRGAPRRFVHALGAAALLNVLAATSLRIAGVAPGPESFAAALGGLTVIAGAVGAARGGTLPRLAGSWPAIGVAGGAFVLAWVAGTIVVPPLEDQDMEVQGTAWGLAHDLEPLCLTNRSTLYFFAHPLLLHAFNASTLTLAGELADVRGPWAAAAAARAELPSGGPERGLGAARRALGGPPPRPDRSFRWFHEVYKPFLERPALFGTRAPNWTFAAAVAALLFAAARRLGVSAGDAALVTATYATLPEIFVRSGYGGYYALTAATLLAGAGLAAGRDGGGRSGYVAGALAILTNQKALVVAAGAAAARLAAAVARRSARELAPVAPFLLGVAAGGAAFCVYGLAIAPEEFVADGLLEHGLARFGGSEAMHGAGKVVYPSRAGVWLELARNLGWGWTTLAAVGLALGIRDAARDPASERGRTIATLTAWVLVGAIVFTATDWRQTKHLCLLVPAFAALIAALLPAAPRVARLALRVGLVLSLAWNARGLAQLAADFGSITVTPVW